MGEVEKRKSGLAKSFFLLLVLSPGLWSLITNISEVVKNYLRTPSYIEHKVGSIFYQDKILTLNEMRWANVDTDAPLRLISKLFYSKITILVNELFDYISFFSPRFYFQSGDGLVFTPTNTEPIAIILFPFFVFGLIVLTKRQGKRTLFIAGSSGVFAYLTGQKNMAFLWPVFISYLYFSAVGINILSKKNKRRYLLLFSIYGVFIVFRSLWLKV